MTRKATRSASRKGQTATNRKGGQRITKHDHEKAEREDKEDSLMESNSDNSKLPEIYRALLQRLLTAEELAAWWQIDIKTVYAYAQRGDIPSIRVNNGRSVRFVQCQ